MTTFVDPSTLGAKTATAFLHRSGFYALFVKEVKRFWRVVYQTVAAPVLTAWLYLAVFGHLLEGRAEVFANVSYTTFLMPGLVMMSVLQNAFANTSSSLIQSKMTGNLVFLLLSPISYRTMFAAYVAAAVVRGIAVGVGVLALGWLYTDLPFYNIFWAFLFILLGSGLLGALGIIAGLWSEKFDHMAVFQNFIILPATFLSGVFYSVQLLPPVWQFISHLNPFFYVIDGFRYGFFGKADVSPFISLAIVSVNVFVVSLVAIAMLKKGYKIRQ